MRIAKLKVPKSVFPSFLDYTKPLALTLYISKEEEDIIPVEIPFSKEQSPKIDELEQFFELLLAGILLSQMTAETIVEVLEEILEEIELSDTKKSQNATSTLVAMLGAKETTETATAKVSPQLIKAEFLKLIMAKLEPKVKAHPKLNCFYIEDSKFSQRLKDKLAILRSKKVKESLTTN
jgi:hypothetical protein